MSRRKISIEYYKKRKEKTHVQTLEDIIQGFDNSMQSPDVPAATQPQDASRTTFLPPNPKKLKPDIDLTTEPDIAVEQPLPMVPPTQAPPGPPTSCAPGQMRTTQPFLDILHGAKDVFQSQLSSPSITTQPHTRSVIDNNLARAPIKRQHHQQRSSAGDDMAGVCSSRSKSHQSSSLTNPTERSFVPSMASSLPSAPNKAPSSVRTSPSAKRNSVGSCTHHGHSDIKRLPLGTAGRPPGSLLADLYNLGGFQSSPATMSSGRNSYDGSGDQRDSGRHRNSPDKKKAEPVVVIDEDEGGDSSRNQTRSSTGKASREPKETPHDVSEQVSGASSCGGYQNQNESKGGGQRKAEPSPSLAIPPLKELKEVRPSVTKSSPLKLNKSRDTRRSGNKERKEDTQAVSRGVAAAPVYVSAGETPDSTGTQTGIVQRHTTASSSDDVVVMDETTSKYFETSSRSKRGRSETPPVAEEVWPSASTTPSPDILTKIAPTQQVVVGKMRPQDSSSPPIKFIPRYERSSPENGRSNNSSDVQVTAKHHNIFAKNQSSSGGAHMESKSSGSSHTKAKAKARLSSEALSTIPRLSEEGFSFERSAAAGAGGKESKQPAKKTSRTKKDAEVVFQAEEHPGGGKQYNTRAREKRQIRVSDSSDDHISEEDSDFQQQPSWNKKPPSAKKNNTKTFYRGTYDNTFDVMMNVAADNTRKAMDDFSKRRTGARAGRGRGGATGKGGGGSSQRTVKGSTSGRGNVKAVFNEFHIPQKKPRVGRVSSKKTVLLPADEDETTLDLNMLQIGRLISDGAFNLEVKSREFHFQFECGKLVNRHIVELKHLTSWRMNLGEGPQFIAVEVDLAATNKLRSALMGKFHLDSDFFKQSSQDPSQHYIIFRLAGPIYPQDVASINEMLDGLNGETLTFCEITREMSSEDASAFLESVKPSKPARREVHLFSNTEMNELSLPDRDTTSDDVATITGHSSTGKGPGGNELRRSKRQKRPPSRMYSTTHHLSIEDSDSQEEEQPVQRRSKTPNVKLLTYKPQGSKVTLDIMSADVECLEPGEYLNDKIIDFYLNYLLYEKLSEEFQSRVHIFSTFFYTRLSNASMDDKASNCSTPEKLHTRVKTWTRRVDLFLKDYIILPVCDRAHWYVVVVCHPGRFDPSKVKPPQPKRPKQRGRPRKSMRLQKKRQSPKGAPGPSEATEQQGGGGEMEEKKEEATHLEQQDQGLMEDDSLEINEEASAPPAEEEEEMDVDMLHTNLPDIAEVRSGVSMSPEPLHQPLNLNSAGDCDLLEGEDMEQGEGDGEGEGGESPFTQFALTGVIPETPTSSQDCDREGEDEVMEESRNMDNSVASSTIVISPDTVVDSGSAAGRSPSSLMRNENTVQCVPIAIEETPQPTDLGRELAGPAATGDYLPLETGLIDLIPPPSASSGCQEGEPLVDEVIGESGGEEEGEAAGEEEEEEGGGSAIGVEGVEVKQELLEEEEETEPQARPCIQILDSLGIKRPSTARRIRNYLTMEWKSKKGDKDDKMSFEYLPLEYPAIPLQDNSSDCGIFVLQFIESLLGTIQQGLPPPSVAEEWASYDKTRAKRKELEKLITELQTRDKAS